MISCSPFPTREGGWGVRFFNLLKLLEVMNLPQCHDSPDLFNYQFIVLIIIQVAGYTADCRFMKYTSETRFL